MYGKDCEEKMMSEEKSPDMDALDELFGLLDEGLLQRLLKKKQGGMKPEAVSVEISAEPAMEGEEDELKSKLMG